MSAVELASDTWTRAVPQKDSRNGITGILTLRVGLTIILHGESYEEDERRQARRLAALSCGQPRARVCMRAEG